MKKKKVDKEQLKELWKNPRSRAIAFFAVYFVFFFLVAMMIRSGASQEPTSSSNSSLTANYQFTLLNQNNYHYIYQITKDHEVITFEGDRSETKEEFLVRKGAEDKEYFNNDGIFLVHDDLWKLASSPYIYEEFYRISQIEMLLKTATLLSKTEYQDQVTKYVYQLSTTSIVSLFEARDIDLMDDPNELALFVRDGQVYQIEWDLSSYATYLEEEEKTLKMELSYSRFGEIGELEIPKYEIE